MTSKPSILEMERGTEVFGDDIGLIYIVVVLVLAFYLLIKMLCFLIRETLELVGILEGPDQTRVLKGQLRIACEELIKAYVELMFNGIWMILWLEFKLYIHWPFLLIKNLPKIIRFLSGSEDSWVNEEQNKTHEDFYSPLNDGVWGATTQFTTPNTYYEWHTQREWKYCDDLEERMLRAQQKKEEEEEEEAEEMIRYQTPTQTSHYSGYSYLDSSYYSPPYPSRSRSNYYNSSSSSSSSSFTPISRQHHTAAQQACTHNVWWPEIQGRTICTSCGESWSYLLQCPGCDIMACPKCQAGLRPRKRYVVDRVDRVGGYGE